ncbi:MAG: hypothetical protein ACRYF4_08835 [Janthinobacterium lividum]
MPATQSMGLAPLSGAPQTAGLAAGLRFCRERVLGLNAVLALAVALFCLLLVPRSMADPDIWWHLRNAQTMLTQHIFVTHDTYSFTVQGVPWIDHEWLAELPFYLAWKAGGSTGVYLVTETLTLSIFLPVLFLCWKASRSALTACVATATVVLLATVSLGPRTLLFGWLCLVCELVLLERFRHDAKAALALPPLYLLWVNLHGSWLIGLGVLAIVVASGHLPLQRAWIYADRFTRQQSRMLAVAAAGIIPALFCNPWGWRLVAYPFNFAFRQTLNVASIDEWRSLQLHSMRGDVFLAAVALLVGRQLWRPRAWSVQEVLLLAGGLYAAMTHERFLFLLAILAAPIAARSFPGEPVKQEAVPRPGYHAALIFALLFVAFTFVHKAGRADDAAMRQYPTPALMAAVSRLPPDSHLMNEYGWGGYLEWHQPQTPVFIDSRVDIFEYNDVLRDYLDIIHIENTAALLGKYHIKAVLFENKTPLVYLLRRTGDWRVTYEDANAVLLQRTAPLQQ